MPLQCNRCFRLAHIHRLFRGNTTAVYVTFRALSWRTRSAFILYFTLILGNNIRSKTLSARTARQSRPSRGLRALCLFIKVEVFKFQLLTLHSYRCTLHVLAAGVCRGSLTSGSTPTVVSDMVYLLITEKFQSTTKDNKT